MVAGLRSHDRLLDMGQQLLGLGQRHPKLAMSRRSLGRLSFNTSMLHIPPSALVSTGRNTRPIHNPPVGSGPASHIAPVHIPNLWTLPPAEVVARTASFPISMALAWRPSTFVVMRVLRLQSGAVPRRPVLVPGLHRRWPG